jgi:hypothetical protein
VNFLIIRLRSDSMEIRNWLQRIDLCSVCKKNKAEYLYITENWLYKVRIRVLCQKCYEIIDELK